MQKCIHHCRKMLEFSITTKTVHIFSYKNHNDFLLLGISLDTKSLKLPVVYNRFFIIQNTHKTNIVYVFFKFISN